MKYWGILPAAGSGSRLTKNWPKQYCKINGRYIIDYSLTALLSHPLIKTIVVSLKKNDPYWHQSEYAQDSRIWVCQGGVRREHSVWSAMRFLQAHCGSDDWVLIHDAARPCLSAEDLTLLIISLQDDSVGGILAQTNTDAIKRAATDGTIEQSLNRCVLYQAQTPQMFRYQLLFSALENIIKKDISIDDEAVAMELVQHRVHLVKGRGFNVKVTYPSDLISAKAWLDHAARLATKVGS